MTKPSGPRPRITPSRGGTKLLVPLVTYKQQPLMTAREWLAFCIGAVCGGALASGIIWLIEVMADAQR